VVQTVPALSRAVPTHRLKAGTVYGSGNYGIGVCSPDTRLPSGLSVPPALGPFFYSRFCWLVRLGLEVRRGNDSKLPVQNFHNRDR
jgi:hypothetical protein